MNGIQFFDAHVHANSCSMKDFERLSKIGCEGLMVVAGPEGGFRMPESIWDHFRRLHHVDVPRIQSVGLACLLALGAHPAGLPERDIDRFLDGLPMMLLEYGAVAVGEVGLEQAGALEEYVLSSQLEIAAKLGLVVLVHTPRKNKTGITERIVRILQDSCLDTSRVLVDHLDAGLVPEILELGAWAGLSIHPAKLSPSEAAEIVERYGADRLVLSTDMGAGASYLFGIPAAVHAMQAMNIDTEAICKVARDNFCHFLGLDC